MRRVIQRGHELAEAPDTRLSQSAGMMHGAVQVDNLVIEPRLAVWRRCRADVREKGDEWERVLTS
jgi:hypothetical protein